MPLLRLSLRSTALACLLALPGIAWAQDLGALALSLVDEDRATEGLPPLERSPRLDEVARAHAEDMLARGYYDHVSPEGEDVRDRFLDAGGGRGPVVAENLARCEGCPTPAGPERVRDFQEGWMQSPGHRDNVLAEGLTRFGFGTASGDGVTLAVQVFAGPGAPPHASPDAAPVGRGEAAAEALDAVNAARAGADRPTLEASDALDAAAREAARGAALDGDGLSLPEDLFALLPEGAGGWTGLAISAEACTGCGARRVRGDAAHFADGLAQGAMDGATHMGFALRADGTGLKTAVAVFGTR